MLRSHPCRAATGVVAATLFVSQGCYVYRPTALPVSAGATIRVRAAPLSIYNGTQALSAPADCHASEIYGRLRDARGDTLLIAPVRGMSQATPRRACGRLSAATLVAIPATTTVALRQFSGWRTTGLVVGAVATAAAVAAIIVVGDYSHANPNMRSP